MAHTKSAKEVRFRNGQSTDPDSNVRGDGVSVYGEIDVTSYTNGGEVISASILGLSQVFNAQFQCEENDAYSVRAPTIASDRKSLTLNVDTAGSGTEVSASTDVGRLAFVAWGREPA